VNLEIRRPRVAQMSYVNAHNGSLRGLLSEFAIILASARFWRHIF